MSVDNVVDDGGIRDIGGAFIVNHYIIGFGPIRICVDLKVGLRRLIIGVYDGDLGMNTRFKSLRKKGFLRGIVVAATANDEENFEGFDFRLGKAEASQGTTDEE